VCPCTLSVCFSRKRICLCFFPSDFDCLNMDNLILIVCSSTLSVCVGMFQQEKKNKPPLSLDRRISSMDVRS
jgi:hypothetical protein